MDRQFFSILLAVVSAPLLIVPAEAASPPPASPANSPTIAATATFDHLKDGKKITEVSLKLQSKDYFEVDIAHTCSGQFKMEVDGIVSEDSGASAVALAAQQAAIDDATTQVAEKAQDLQAITGQLEAVRRTQSQLASPASARQLVSGAPPAAVIGPISPRGALQLNLIRAAEQAQPANRVKAVQNELDTELTTLRSALSAKTDELTAAQQNLASAKNATPAVARCTANDTLKLQVEHHKKNQAYEVAVSEINGKSDDVPVVDGSGNPIKGSDGKAEVLSPARYLVVTPSSVWGTVFSAGFTVSSLTNPKYSLTPGTGTNNTTYTVERVKSSEDKATAGLAAFVTITNSDWSFDRGQILLGPTFGLGTNTGSKLQYYPGISAICGQLIVTLGVNIGSVDTLPAGLSLGGTTTQANALGSLPTRIATGGFLSLSYTFLGSGTQSALAGAIAPAKPATGK